MGTREPVVYTSPSLATIEEVDVPSRLKTIEPGLTVAEPPYYTGDVANAISDAPPETNRSKKMEAAFLWATMAAVAPPPSIVNRRKDTQYLAGVEAEIPDDRMTDKAST
jgi:hypothetical protein